MPAQTIPLLIELIVVAVLGTVLWGLWRARSHSPDPATLIAEPRSDLLVWLLALAALIFGIFVTYVLARP